MTNSMVRVDHEARENYLKLRREGGDEYLWISFPRGEDAPWGPEGRANLTDEPVWDLDELQPVTIPADTAKQFWLTARVPSYAPAGTYRGEIAIRAGDETVETLGLELEVLPFELAANPLELSIYFHWGIDLIDEPGSLKYNQRSASQYPAELRNLLEHGVDNPTMGVTFASGNLPLALTLREQVGMAQDHLYYLKASASTEPEQVREIIALARSSASRTSTSTGRMRRRATPCWPSARRGSGCTRRAARSSSPASTARASRRWATCRTCWSATAT